MLLPDAVRVAARRGGMAIMAPKAAALSMAILLLCVASGAQARGLLEKHGMIA